jgi:hypothetical protein
MLCRFDGPPSVAHARGAAAEVCLALALVACSPTTTGATLTLPPRPGKVVDVGRIGQPPASAQMCMPGERGCIETGWGPGWDVDQGREGHVHYHYAASPPSERYERARREHQVTGPCRLYWESEWEVGSAPMGDCR